MHKNVTKCNKTQCKWCINKHGASKNLDTFETYQYLVHAPPQGHAEQDQGSSSNKDVAPQQTLPQLITATAAMQIGDIRPYTLEAVQFVLQRRSTSSFQG
jgi:hypothetical protein